MGGPLTFARIISSKVKLSPDLFLEMAFPIDLTLLAQCGTVSSLYYYYLWSGEPLCDNTYKYLFSYW